MISISDQSYIEIRCNKDIIYQHSELEMESREKAMHYLYQLFSGNWNGIVRSSVEAVSRESVWQLEVAEQDMILDIL